MALLSSCGNEAKKETTEKKTDTPKVAQDTIPAAESFTLTSEHYPEYVAFEQESKGFDPCELLTMNDITTTCKPTSEVTINNRGRDFEKVCSYHWIGTDGQLCNVRFSVLSYSMEPKKLAELFKPDKDGIIQHSDWGVRWLVGNKVLMVTYTGELIKKVNILTVKDHVRPFRR